jgi:PKD repeat protein
MTEVTLTVTDDSGASDSCTATVTVVDVSEPEITSVTPDSQVVSVGSPANFLVEATDNCSCMGTVWQFDVDNPLPEEFGDCESMNHTYSSPGIYSVGVVAVDDAGNESDPAFVYVVVYDPDGGFVTGGGWIYSEPGAYVPDPTLEGKANFGFVSKYKKGATKPTGNTEFQFHVGDLNFHSSDYDWLVVTGNDYARYKGTGTINGEGDYKFMLWAGDSDPDVFRIKIWTEVETVEIVEELEVVVVTEIVEYDNGFEGSGYENGQPIDGGSIIVHTSKK